MQMYYPYIPQPQYRQGHQRVMTVTGSSSILAEPDTISIQLEVRTENDLLRKAQQENTNKMNQVIQALLNVGIPRENIQTAEFNIFPMYDYVDGKQVFKGYQVTNRITVKLTNINQAGNVIDSAVSNGVNQVSNIEFSIENPEKIYQEALSEALRDAVDKAKVIAGTLQLNLDSKPVKIIELVNENESPAAFKTFTAIEGSTPIQPGQLSVRAAVKTKFQY